MLLAGTSIFQSYRPPNAADSFEAFGLVAAELRGFGYKLPARKP